MGEPAKPIRILLADDHAIVRKGLRALLEAKHGVTVIGEAADGQQAIVQARRLRPDVILLDLAMPQQNGVEAIQAIMQENPDAKILVLTSFAENSQVHAAIKEGALGYLLKESRPRELLNAIQKVSRGEPAIQPGLAHKMVKELSQRSIERDAKVALSDRELEVLRLVAQGLTNQEIAKNMMISVRTVTTHVSNILSKLHLDNRTQAALYALRKGLAELD